MRDKLTSYFVTNILPKTTVAYNVNIEDMKTYPMNGKTKIACNVYANFIFTPICCADVEEREVLDSVFEFTVDKNGSVVDCNMIEHYVF